MKITPKHITAAGDHIVIIDNEGRVWKRAIDGTTWYILGELPEEPEEDHPLISSVDLDLNQIT